MKIINHLTHNSTVHMNREGHRNIMNYAGYPAKSRGGLCNDGINKLPPRPSDREPWHEHPGFFIQYVSPKITEDSDEKRCAKGDPHGPQDTPLIFSANFISGKRYPKPPTSPTLYQIRSSCANEPIVIQLSNPQSPKNVEALVHVLLERKVKIDGWMFIPLG